MFWSEALGWPLVWDQDEETAIQSPHGGTKVAWGGPPVAPKVSRSGSASRSFRLTGANKQRSTGWSFWERLCSRTVLVAPSRLLTRMATSFV